MILVPQFLSNSILIQKFIFVVFSPYLRKKSDRSLDFNSREKNILTQI